MAEKLSTVNRVDYIYQSHEHYLKGTDAATAVATYLEIESKTRDDLLSLRVSINKYKDSIPSDDSILNPVTLYNAVNRLLEVIEAEIVGDTALTSFTLLGVKTAASDSVTEELSSINVALETAVGKDALPSVTMLGVKTDAASSVSGEFTALNGALETAVGKDALPSVTMLGVKTDAASSVSGEFTALNGALETAVGRDSLPSVTMLGVKTDAASSVSGEFTALNGALETAVGKDALTDISLFGVVISAATSLSTHINNLVAALKDSLGSTKIAPDTPVTVMSCTRAKGKYALDKEIYTTSNDVTKTIFNIFECAKWADGGSRDDLYFTPTGLVDDCTPLLLGKGFEVCAHYLHPNP